MYIKVCKLCQTTIANNKIYIFERLIYRVFRGKWIWWIYSDDQMSRTLNWHLSVFSFKVQFLCILLFSYIRSIDKVIIGKMVQKTLCRVVYNIFVLKFPNSNKMVFGIMSVCHMHSALQPNTWKDFNHLYVDIFWPYL